MTTHRINGFAFNRDNLAGLDTMERAGVNRYLAARERVINTIETESLPCSGGPFDGQIMELTKQHDGGGATAVLTVGKWTGHYARHTQDVNGAEYACALWRGTDQLDTVKVYTSTKQAKTIKETKPLGKGFAQLGELLAHMAQPQTTIEHAGQVFAVFAIGRMTYRVLNTPESIEALRVKILKAKKWFTDAMLARNGARKVEPIQAGHDAAASDAVAQVVAQAVAAAAIAHACESSQDVTESRDLATVCEGAQAAGQTVHQGSAKSWRIEPGQSGQFVSGKSGQWRARLTNDNGPALTFEGAGGSFVSLTFEDGSARMRALQELARDADRAAQERAPGVLQITLTRAEGLADECGRPVTVGSFAAADATLHAWSESAPRAGGYDKCDFIISWPNGDSYDGRYDLKHHSTGPASLTAHMVDIAEFYTGKNCPAHMSAAAYASHMERTAADTQKAYGEILEIMGALGAYFPKARPVAIDLRALVAEGLPLPELVGMGVTYAGDMSNADGVGAIVAAEPCSWAGVRVTVVLEDGRQMTPTAAEFGDKAGDRYRLDYKHHGAPYLAQLQAAQAARTARRTSGEAIAKQAHTQALQDLAAEFPQLVRAGEKHAGGKLAAVNIRILLKAEFKGVKFSVTSDYNSVRIHWIDGPTGAQVDAVVGRFDIGHSDSQTDYFYTKGTAWSELFGGVQYLFPSRGLSDAAVAAIIAQEWPESEGRPTVEEYRQGSGATRDHCGRCRVHLAATSWAPNA